MNRRIVSLALTGAMVFSLMSTSAFAADVEDISEPAAISETAEDISPRLGGEKTLTFGYAGQEKVLVSDGNWCDAKVVIDNYDSNPGSVKVRVVAYDTNGYETQIGSPFTVPKGGSNKSSKIPNSYSSYIVYVTALAAGSYKLGFHDEGA